VHSPKAKNKIFINKTNSNTNNNNRNNTLSNHTDNILSEMTN